MYCTATLFTKSSVTLLTPPHYSEYLYVHQNTYIYLNLDGRYMSYKCTKCSILAAESIE